MDSVMDSVMDALVTPGLGLLIACIAGLLMGSFLNVCIYRLTRDLSVVWPGSHCINCGHPIAWFDNIPVASFLLLGARCRHCGTRISWRYPVVEALTAVLFMAGFLTFGPAPGAIKFAVFAFLLVGMIFSDLDQRILPDEFTKGGILAGFLLAFLVPLPQGLLSLLLRPIDPRWVSLIESALAAGFASGTLWLVGAIYSKVRHKEGLGFGDVKMVAMMGAFLGLPGTFAAVMLGCIAGSLIGLSYIHLAKKDAATYELPFGSFLGAAALLIVLSSQGWLQWYRSL
ncbi:MAG: prepilin peptidase [Acidobacteriia bacterium]|nr:prepilin peptidase [Terriglobia bacterium]